MMEKEDYRNGYECNHCGKAGFFYTKCFLMLKKENNNMERETCQWCGKKLAKDMPSGIANFKTGEFA